MNSVIKENYDRYADKIVELYNQELGDQGLEEEKVDTKKQIRNE